MEPQRIDFDVTFTDGTTERVTVQEDAVDNEPSTFLALDASSPTNRKAHISTSAERCATAWAVGRLGLRAIDGDHASGIASIRRVDVRRKWSFVEARDMSAWRALVLAAVDAGVVIRGEWDEGSGWWPWYVANPGPAELALYDACCVALTPKDSPVEDAELVEMEERANANIDDDNFAVRAIARDSLRLGNEVLRLRNEVFLAQRKLGEMTAERVSDWRGCPTGGEVLAHNARTGGDCFGPWLWREHDEATVVVRMVAVCESGALDIPDDLPRDGQWRPITRAGDGLPWPTKEGA